MTKESGIVVAVDLNNTLVNQWDWQRNGKHVLVPGTLNLLHGLKKQGHTVVLLTTAGEGYVDQVFAAHPELDPYFSSKYHNQNTPQQDPMTLDDPEKRAVLVAINNGYLGGKNPHAIDAVLMIDDSVDRTAQTALGFQAIEVPGPRDDPTDGWVAGVLAEVKKLFG